MSLSAYERGYKFGQRGRNTVFLTVLMFFIGAGSTFWWHSEVFAFLLAPAEEKLSPLEGGLPIYTGVPDMFSLTLSLSAKGGQLFAFPIIVWGSLSMLKPFVPRRFWLFVLGYTVLFLTMFTVGDIFVYYVMMPVSLAFLLTFGKEIAIPVILLSEYLDLMLALLKWMGLSFTLPVVMQLFSRFRIVSYQRVRELRKWAYPTAFIFAALITPSLDGALTFLVAIPMLLLYEVGLIAVWLTYNPDGNNYFADLPMLQKTRGLMFNLLKKIRTVAWLPVRGSRWLWRKALLAFFG